MKIVLLTLGVFVLCLSVGMNIASFMMRPALPYHFSTATDGDVQRCVALANPKTIVTFPLDPERGLDYERGMCWPNGIGK